MNNEDALYTKNKLDETLTKFNMVVNEQKKLRDNMQKEFERS